MINDFAAELANLPWAMDPRALAALMSRVGSFSQASIDAAFARAVESGTAEAFGNLRDGASSSAGYAVTDGVAVLSISGPMMRQVPCGLAFFGIAATSTDELREQLAAAVEDPRVDSILIEVDSPGGTVAGTAALAADVRAAAELKPVAVHAADQMASAALWVGCQAAHVTVGPSATIGSVGVVAVVTDSSRAAEAAGLAVHVVSSADLKGGFVPGAPIAPAALEDLERTVGELTDLFVAAVAEGRGLELDAARELATGQCWIGATAVSLGLADAVTDHPAAIRANTNAPELGAKNTTEASAIDPKDTKQADAGAELDELRAELTETKARADAAEAKSDAAAAQLEAANLAAVENLIAANRDRIAPAAIEHVQKYAAAVGHDLALVTAFVESMPVVTRPDPAGEVPIEDADGSSVELTAAQSELVEALGPLLGFDAEAYKQQIAH